jgi:hypothetical protein
MSDKAVTLPIKDGRDQGLYVLGLQGMGKSSLLLDLIKQDIDAGRGVCVLDPHGDLALGALALVPEHRTAETLFLDMTDQEHPFGFDLFTGGKPEAAGKRVGSILKKIWGDSSWGARMEDILRNLGYAFAEVGGLALPDAIPMLTVAAFRRRVVEKVRNPIVKSFWQEFESWNASTKSTAIGPVRSSGGRSSLFVSTVDSPRRAPSWAP